MNFQELFLQYSIVIDESSCTCPFPIPILLIRNLWFRYFANTFVWRSFVVTTFSAFLLSMSFRISRISFSEFWGVFWAD